MKECIRENIISCAILDIYSLARLTFALYLLSAFEHPLSLCHCKTTLNLSTPGETRKSLAALDIRGRSSVCDFLEVKIQSSG